MSIYSIERRLMKLEKRLNGGDKLIYKSVKYRYDEAASITRSSKPGVITKDFTGDYGGIYTLNS